jgi:hypothetical protein
LTLLRAELPDPKSTISRLHPKPRSGTGTPCDAVLGHAWLVKENS